MSKKDAAVYLMASEYIERGIHMQCCCAIARAELSHWTRSEICKSFTTMFFPAPPINRVNWGHEWGNKYEEYGGEDARACRILALCFAAAMAEAGDL